MPPVLFSATVVCPMVGPPLADAGVLADDGAIAAVGPVSALQGHAARRHHVDGALLPGLVNAHAHLELADAAAVPIGEWTPDRWGRSAHRGVTEMLRAGGTVVGDVVRHGAGVPAAARAQLRGTSWVEVNGVDITHHDRIVNEVQGALRLPAGGREVGIAPASPTAVGTGVLQALGALASRERVSLHLHLAETQAEVVALAKGAGPLADQARARGLAFEWLDGGVGLSPVGYADACGVLGPATSIAHAVWVDTDDAAVLAARGTTVVCCPRANARGGGEAPLELYADAATPLALGTCSAPGSLSMDLLEEAAAWAELARRRGLAAWPAPDGPTPLPEQALRLLTVDGAEAMGWGGAGTLAEGRRADLVAVAVPTSPATVYEDLLDEGRGRQVLTVLGGVARARRADPEVAWPALDAGAWRG